MRTRNIWICAMPESGPDNNAGDGSLVSCNTQDRPLCYFCLQGGLDMLSWITDYYVAGDISDAEKLRKRIDRGRKAPGIYLVTLSDTPGNQMEYFAADQLRVPILRRYCGPVIGIAGSRDSARALVLRILSDAAAQTGRYDARYFLSDRDVSGCLDKRS